MLHQTNKTEWDRFSKVEIGSLIKCNLYAAAALIMSLGGLNCFPFGQTQSGTAVPQVPILLQN